MRDRVSAAHRIVIKIGSSSLTGKSGGQLDSKAVDALVDVVAGLKNRVKKY